jgi:hypothetical protein
MLSGHEAAASAVLAWARMISTASFPVAVGKASSRSFARSLFLTHYVSLHATHPPSL